MWFHEWCGSALEHEWTVKSNLVGMEHFGARPWHLVQLCVRWALARSTFSVDCSFLSTKSVNSKWACQQGNDLLDITNAFVFGCIMNKPSRGMKRNFVNTTNFTLSKLPVQ